MEHLLTSVLYMPLAGALVIAAVPKERERAIRWIALVVSVVAFALSLALIAGFDQLNDERFQFVTALPWVPQLGIQYKTGIDGIGLVLVLLTTLLSWIAVLYSWDGITERVKAYYIILLLLETGMLGVFVALDMILFYVFWEAMLVPMYFLIGVWGGPRRIYATLKFVVYTLIGSLLMLVAIVAIHVATRTPTAIAGSPGPAGTFDLEYILTNYGALTDAVANAPLLQPATLWSIPLQVPTAPLWMFLAFALAFAIKVPVWPFHTWLPDAHTEAPTAGSVILAGVLLKMGTYGFVRFCLPLFPRVSLQLAPIFVALAVIGIIYGALVALAQRDMKKLVAYSSVSHLGFVMLGIFAFTQPALEGAVLQMLNHGLSTGALFLLVGMLYERRHTREIAAYGGIWAVVPVLTAFFLITTLSSIGLPGLNGFIGEFMILLGSWLGGREGATALAATGVILGATYMLWLFQRVFQGPIEDPENRSLRDMGLSEWVVMVPLVLLMFFIGIWPNATLRLFDRAVAINVLGHVRPAMASSTRPPSLSPPTAPGAMTPGAMTPGATTTPAAPAGATPGSPIPPGAFPPPGRPPGAVAPAPAPAARPVRPGGER
jgi:NADH-quinone oxidoreductase subunit M